MILPLAADSGAPSVSWRAHARWCAPLGYSLPVNTAPFEIRCTERSSKPWRDARDP
jgi:hypothetical protein